MGVSVRAVIPIGVDPLARPFHNAACSCHCLQLPLAPPHSPDRRQRNRRISILQRRHPIHDAGPQPLHLAPRASSIRRLPLPSSSRASGAYMILLPCIPFYVCAAAQLDLDLKLVLLTIQTQTRDTVLYLAELPMVRPF
jgi:hypothetical protein